MFGQQILKSVTVLLFLLAASIANAQGPGSNPTITGTVTDPEGAVIPGVKITAVNTDRHIKLKAVTSQAGTFLFTALAPGHYVIQAKSRDWELREPVKITIEISSNPSFDLKMQPRHKKK